MSNYKTLDLPSRGLVYNINPAEIKIRPLKGKDEKFIASMSYDNLEKKFCDLIREVITGIEPEKLTIGDRLYILVWLVINSYSPKTEMEIVCRNCFQRVVIPVDLSKLEVAMLPEDFKEPYDVSLSDGSVIGLRLFRVEDEIKVVEYESKDQNSWLYRYALSIVNGNDVIENMKYLEGLGTKDLAKIRAFHEKFYHGPIMETGYTCPKCRAEEVVTCPFRLDWLLPYGKTLVRIIGDGV